MAGLDETTFHGLWGTGGVAAPVEETGTRVVDPKAFESQWFSEPKKSAKEAAAPANIGQGRAEGVTALRGVPIAGGYADKAAAAVNAAATPFISTPGMSDAPSFSDRMAENEKRITAGADKYAAENPVKAGVLQFAGGTAAMGPLAATRLGAGALGLTGSLFQRAGAGMVGGAAISGADSAVRSGGDLQQTGVGAAVGGGIGMAAPMAGRAIGAGVNRLMSPAVDATTNYLLQRAEQFGIPIRPAQSSTSPFINKLDQMVPKIPGSGMGKVIDEQQGAFNRAVAKTFGEDAGAITTDVMARAKKRIGSEFDHVANNTAIRFDAVLNNDLSRVVREAGTVLEPSQVAPLANRVLEIAKMARTGVIDGEAYQNMLKQGAPLNRLMKDADPNKRFYAGQIREALDDALQRSATPEMANRLQQARLQYKNMKTVEDLAEKAPSGNVSPLLLMGQVRKSFPNMAYGGGGDLADLARIGQRFMKQPPDSGTPLGNKVLDLFTHAAPAIAGAGIGAGAAYHGGFDPTTDIGLGLGGLLATAAAARGAGRFMLQPQMIENALTRAPVYAPQIKNRLLEDRSQ